MTNDRIQVGIIRCDTHAVWYGILMQAHDARFLQFPVPDNQEVVYGWQRGGTVHRYFYLYGGQPTEMTVPSVDGFEIVKVWDHDRSAAESFAKLFYGKPEVCDSLEQVSDDVDLVFIGDCNFDGADHVELATPGLTKGVAAFVDKPFGGTLANGQKLVSLAREHRAPITSASLMTFMPTTVQFQSRFAEVDGVDAISIEGGGTAVAGLIHTIALAQHLCGPNVECVSTIKRPGHTIIHLDYGRHPGIPRCGVTIQCNITAMAAGVYAHAFGWRGRVGVTYNDWGYASGAVEVLKHIHDMMRTRTTPQIQIDAMLAALKTLDEVRRQLGV